MALFLLNCVWIIIWKCSFMVDIFVIKPMTIFDYECIRHSPHFSNIILAYSTFLFPSLIFSYLFYLFLSLIPFICLTVIFLHPPSFCPAITLSPRPEHNTSLLAFLHLPSLVTQFSSVHKLEYIWEYCKLYIVFTTMMFGWFI